MARSERLPIYKASYDLCLYFEQVVHRFSRYHKYAIGSHLRPSGLRPPFMWAWAVSRTAATV
jgi:hypothetical protein